jgi:hypothetical protein
MEVKVEGWRSDGPCRLGQAQRSQRPPGQLAVIALAGRLLERPCRPLLSPQVSYTGRREQE